MIIKLSHVVRADLLYLSLFRGVLVDVAFKGVSVEADFEDIESSYGKQVSLSCTMACIIEETQ